MEAPREMRLANQTSDAAGRLHRTTGLPTLAMAVDAAAGGVAFGFHGPTLAELQFAAFQLLKKIEAEYLSGQALHCADCAGALARASAALDALDPSRSDAAPPLGHC